MFRAPVASASAKSDADSQHADDAASVTSDVHARDDTIASVKRCKVLNRISLSRGASGRACPPVPPAPCFPTPPPPPYPSLTLHRLNTCLAHGPACHTALHGQCRQRACLLKYWRQGAGRTGTQAMAGPRQAETGRAGKRGCAPRRLPQKARANRAMCVAGSPE